MSPAQSNPQVSDAKAHDVLIVGAGMGGLYQLHLLRKQGYDVKVLDKGAGLGGVWYWNCYPGARVDSNMPLYELAVENLNWGWTWSEQYPDLPEIRRYFEYVDKRLGLREDIIFNTNVIGAEFEEEAMRWKVRTESGEIYTAKFLILAVGFAAKAWIPNWLGMDQYKGIIHHTAHYPQDGLDLEGKRICVVGTGASGVQFVQEIGPIAKSMTVLQRTPNLALPMRNRKFNPEEVSRDKMEGKYQAAFDHRRKTFGGFDFEFADRNFADDTPEQTRAFYEDLWAKGGFNFWLCNYKDMLFDRKANDPAYEFWAEKTRQRIKNSKKREILAPLLSHQHHTFGTKRPSLEQRYFEVLDQDHVNIIELKKNPVDTFTEKGIKMSSGEELEFDVIILATGFDAITGGLYQMNIRGTEGETLKQKWSRGTSTYLGIATKDFPNMFMLYGPQAPTAFANGPTLLELQAEWVTNCIQFCTKSSIKKIDVEEEAEAKWLTLVDELCARTLLPLSASWYMGANIPGKRVETLNFTGGLPMYINTIEEVAKKQYQGFKYDRATESGGSM